MAVRRGPNKSVEKEVMIASRRRCCLCFFLNERRDVRKGQIAHLNHDPSDSCFENLVYLCFEHHDEYDSRTSQSKGLLLEEVREYRDQLYTKNKTLDLFEKTLNTHEELPALPDLSQYEILEKKFKDELWFLSGPWRSQFGPSANEPELFAYKAPNFCDGVCLIERVDLPDGRIVVICIAPAGNPGNSITNCVEALCFQVCSRFEIPADRLVWIEHYDWDDDSEWSLVEFSEKPPTRPFANPEWTKMTPAMWKGLGLRPKKKLEKNFGSYESKVTKLFPWPND